MELICYLLQCRKSQNGKRCKLSQFKRIYVKKKSNIPSLLLCTGYLKADQRSLQSLAQVVLNMPSGQAVPILAMLCSVLLEILLDSSVLEHQTDPTEQNTMKTHHY